MPYKIKKQKCTQSDGDKGSYVLSYTSKKGKKYNNCHTSKKKARGQIAAIEGPWENKMDTTLRSLIREILSEDVISESGDRGFAYEATLINALSQGGIEVTQAAGNNNTISDLGFSVKGKQVAAEVKLSHEDNLGAIRKNNFDFLIWDGDSFAGAPAAGSKMPDVISALIDAMNNSSKVKSKFKDIEKHIVKYKPLPWNLMTTFGRDRGDKKQIALYSIVRNDPNRFPLPKGVKSGLKSKQIANPGDGTADIDQQTLLSIMSGKSGPNGAPTSYVIVGYGPGSESNVAGQIYSLGSDPLSIGAPTYSPASIGVEIRFGGAGGGKSGRSYSFNFKTKATGGANTGISFSDEQELIDILTGKKKKPRSKK